MSLGTGYEQLNPAVKVQEKCVKYTPDIGDRICAELADGKSLRAICVQSDMPSRISVFRWLREHPEFAENYAAAKKDSADAMADDLTAISDSKDLDPNDKRIMVDTRKWIASKLKPKVYGDKLAVSGDDDGAPIQISWAKPE